MKYLYKSMLLSAFVFLLTACNTTVVSDEDRQLPEPTPTQDEEVLVDTEDHDEDDDDHDDDMDDDDMDDEMDDDDDMDDEVTVKAVDPAQSFIAFVGKKGDLVSHEGKFEDFVAEVIFEDSEPETVSVTAQIGSMVTDSQGLTNHLLNADFFDAENHATATFVSTDVEGDGDSYTITGNLTIKGVTKSITIPATITDAYLTSTFSMDRTDFGVGAPPEGVKAIDAAVPMEIKFVFQ